MKKCEFYTYDEISKLHSLGKFVDGGMDLIGSEFISVISFDNETIVSFLLTRYVDDERNYECVYVNNELISQSNEI